MSSSSFLNRFTTSIRKSAESNCWISQHSSQARAGSLPDDDGGRPHTIAAFVQHESHPVEGHFAGDDSAADRSCTRLSIPSAWQETTGAPGSRLRIEAKSNLRARLLLARSHLHLRSGQAENECCLLAEEENVECRARSAQCRFACRSRMARARRVGMFAPQTRDGPATCPKILGAMTCGAPRKIVERPVLTRSARFGRRDSI